MDPFLNLREHCGVHFRPTVPPYHSAHRHLAVQPLVSINIPKVAAESALGIERAGPIGEPARALGQRTAPCRNDLSTPLPKLDAF